MNRKEARREQNERRTLERNDKLSCRKQRQIRTYGDAKWKQDFKDFNAELEKHGYYIKDVAGDGNCLFRSLADQLEDDPTKHDAYRQRIMQYMQDNRESFEFFIEDDEPFDEYLKRMRKSREWGGHLELHCCARLFNVIIRIYQLREPRFEIGPEGSGVVPQKTIRLSYHDGSHYASVRSLSEITNAKVVTMPTLAVPDNLKTAKEREDFIMKTLNENDRSKVKAALVSANNNLQMAIHFCQQLKDDSFSQPVAEKSVSSVQTQQQEKKSFPQQQQQKTNVVKAKKASKEEMVQEATGEQDMQKIIETLGMFGWNVEQTIDHLLQEQTQTTTQKVDYNAFIPEMDEYDEEKMLELALAASSLNENEKRAEKETEKETETKKDTTANGSKKTVQRTKKRTKEDREALKAEKEKRKRETNLLKIRGKEAVEDKKKKDSRQLSPHPMFTEEDFLFVNEEDEPSIRV